MTRQSHPDLVHFALAVGGFAIGTTEFATMSLLPYFARDLGISAPTAGHVISANALGPLLGGIAIAQGYDLASTGLVGSGLALSGLAIWFIAVKAQR